MPKVSIRMVTFVCAGLLAVSSLPSACATLEPGIEVSLQIQSSAVEPLTGLASVSSRVRIALIPCPKAVAENTSFSLVSKAFAHDLTLPETISDLQFVKDGVPQNLEIKLYPRAGQYCDIALHFGGPTEPGIRWVQDGIDHSLPVEREVVLRLLDADDQPETLTLWDRTPRVIRVANFISPYRQTQSENAWFGDFLRDLIARTENNL